MISDAPATFHVNPYPSTGTPVCTGKKTDPWTHSDIVVNIRQSFAALFHVWPPSLKNDAGVFFPAAWYYLRPQTMARIYGYFGNELLSLTMYCRYRLNETSRYSSAVKCTLVKRQCFSTIKGGRLFSRFCHPSPERVKPIPDASVKTVDPFARRGIDAAYFRKVRDAMQMAAQYRLSMIKKRAKDKKPGYWIFSWKIPL